MENRKEGVVFKIKGDSDSMSGNQKEKMKGIYLRHRKITEGA